MGTPLEKFIEDRCITGDTTDDNLRVPSTALYEAYAAYCRVRDEEPLNLSAFIAVVKSAFGVRHMRKRVDGIRRHFFLGIKLTQDDTAELMRNAPTYSVDDEQTTDGFRRLFGDSWEYKPKPRATLPNFRRVVAVGDLHGRPDPAVVRAITRAQPHLVVIGGDLLDSREASQHHGDSIRRTKEPSLREEMSAIRAFIEVIIDNTEADVLIMRGNHDGWLWKQLQSTIPKWALSFVQDPLELLTAELPKDRVHIVSTAFNFRSPDGTSSPDGASETQFLLPLGDALLSHMNFSGKRAGAGVEKLSAWIDQWHAVLGIPSPRLVVQFHGHKCCLHEERGGFRVCVEPGMGGETACEDYKVDHQPKWMPGALGFVYFEQNKMGKDWQTDLSSVQLIRPKRSKAQ